MARLVVLGAGAMGLAAAYRGLTLGHQVTLVEAAPEPGGMMAHFDLDGLSIERYYHFVCKADQPTFALMRELGIDDKMRWRPTSMGYFTKGKLYPWGDPVSLLGFPHLTIIEKFRYGLLMFISTKLNGWPALENMSAKQWIERWCGANVYVKLWKPLFDLKFYEYADNVSASWIWTRVRRIGRSRKSMMQEELGVIEGGSDTLVAALARAIAAKGGEIRLGEPAKRVVVNDGAVVGVETTKGLISADAVIATVPTPYVVPLLPDLPQRSKAAYAAIENIGVTCVVLKLRRSVTPHFWVNIVDPEMPIPGIIEFSNLRDVGKASVVYVPYYMPVTNPLWDRPDSAFVAESMACIRRINPTVGDGDLIASHVGKLKHAQPICPPGFLAKIPPVQTPIHGLQVADTCFYYPEDRGIAESVRLGQEMAERVAEGRRMSTINDRDVQPNDLEASVAEAVAAETGLVRPPRGERARLLRFLVTGGIAAAVNVLARWVLEHAMRYELAVALAYLFGMTTAFVLARHYVFDAGRRGVPTQYLRFAMVNAVAFAQVWIVSVGLARFLFPAIGWTWHAETIAHVIGVLSPVATSYVGHKRFSFR